MRDGKLCGWVVLGVLLAGCGRAVLAVDDPEMDRRRKATAEVMRRLAVLDDPAASEEEHRKAAHGAWETIRYRGIGDADPARIVNSLAAAYGKDRSTYVRQFAVQALADMRRKEALEPLIAALADADREIQEDACHGLRELGQDALPAIPALTAGIDSGRLPREAMGALAEIQGKEAVETVLRAVKRGRLDEHERYEAAHVFRRYPDPRAADFMESELKTGMCNSRVTAAVYFAGFQDERALKLMRELLYARPQERGPGQQWVPEDIAADLRRIATGYVGQRKDAKSYERILELARTDADIKVVTVAARGLGHYGEAKAIPVLAELCGRNDVGFSHRGHEDGTMHDAAAAALGEIGTDEALSVVFAGLKSEGLDAFDVDRGTEATLARACGRFWISSTRPDLVSKFAGMYRKTPLKGDYVAQVISRMLDKRKEELLKGEEAEAARKAFLAAVRDDKHFGKDVDFTQGGRRTVSMTFQFHKAGLASMHFYTESANTGGRRFMVAGYGYTVSYAKVADEWLPVGRHGTYHAD